MSKKDQATIKGKHVAVFPSADVCVVFKEVTRGGFTSVAKPKTGPKPPLRHKMRQLYRIKTTAVHSPPVEIRIVLPGVPTSGRARLWRWYRATEEWKDITKFFSQKYHFIIGQTNDRLESIFGVT